MFYNREQKSYFLITVITVIVLVIVTFWKPTNFTFKKQPVDQNTVASQNERDEYKEYLASLQVDSQASQQFMKRVVSEDVVRQEAELLLQPDQDIPTPDIPDSDLIITDQAGNTPVTEYFTKAFGATLAHNEQVSVGVSALFAPETPTSLIQSLATRNEALVKNLRGMPVPKEALQYHKAQILAFEHYGNVLRSAETFSRSNTAVQWSVVYRDYSIIDNEIAAANEQFKSLNNTYKFSDALNAYFATQSADSPFLNSAHAIFGFGDLTIVVGDIPHAIWEAIREALARSFARFAIQMLDNMIASVQSLAITSQFQYGKELEQLYVEEYADKYIDDPLDKEILKRMLPETFCIPKNREQLTAIFTQKAEDYLGFDPSNLDPADPNFYDKLAKSGSFLASPQGQELYYQGVADQARAEASAAATKEVLSPGLKAPRDLVTKQITRTMSSIFHVEAAAINGTIELGTQNGTNIIGQIVATTVVNFGTKFLFTGVVPQEQTECIGTSQLTPVVPAEPTDYEYIPPSENPDDYLPVIDPPPTTTQSLR